MADHPGYPSKPRIEPPPAIQQLKAPPPPKPVSVKPYVHPANRKSPEA